MPRVRQRIRQTLEGLVASAIRIDRLQRPALAAYALLRRRDRLAQVHPFDRRMGVRTSGFLPRELLFSGRPEDRHGTIYIGCAPGTVRRMLALLPDPARWAFVDLGCGKGRALVVASEFALRSIRGIELSPELARIAASNAARIARRHRARPPIVIECGDASRPALDGDTVVMMYHPFGAALVDRLLDTLEAAVTAGCSVLLFYINPVHGDRVDARPGFRRWRAVTLDHDPEDRDHVPDDTDSVVIWQAGVTGLPPGTGADRRIVVTKPGWRAELA